MIDFFTTGAIKQSVNMSPRTPRPWRPPRIPQRGLPPGPAPRPDRPSLADQLPLSYKGEVAKKDTRLRRRPSRPDCWPMPCRA